MLAETWDGRRITIRGRGGVIHIDLQRTMQ
jgi:hypothetical protein